HRGSGGRAIGNDKAQVQRARLALQSRADAGESKSAHGGGLEFDFHPAKSSVRRTIRGPKAGASGRPPGRIYASLAVAALVLFARAARTRIVAADFFGVALGGRCSRRLALAAVAHHDALRLGLLNLLDVLLALHLDGKNFLDHV